MRKIALAGIMAAAAGAALVMPPAARAATPSCGSSCVAPYVKAFGSHPLYVADVFKRAPAVHQPVILFQASNSDPAEDWTVFEDGTVNDFAADGLVSKSVALNYGPDEAYELEYTPYGVGTGLCMGAANPVWGAAYTKVDLEACGISGLTVWISDRANAAGKYAPAINGTDVNFNFPSVLSYPGGVNPGDKPRPQLVVHTLTQFSDGTVTDTQLWTVRKGKLP